LRTCLLLTLLAIGCSEGSNATSHRGNTAVNEPNDESGAATPFGQSNEHVEIDRVAEVRIEVAEIDDLSVKPSPSQGTARVLMLEG